MKDRTDTLDRDTYLDFITSVISNSEEYKRDEESKSFVMAIDSAWGTGKTFLLDLLCKRYTDTDDEKVSIIKYSAWQNDFWGSAFEPFAQAIFSNDIFSDLINKNSKKAKAAKLTKESIVNIVKIIGKGVAHKFIEKNAGEDVASLFKELTDASIQIGADLFLKEKDMVFPELTSFQNSIKLLREALSELLGDQKLVIVIDELDRCKPLFAIETLEIIKHIFNVDGLIFVLALDMQQLKHSLNKVYGANMDSVGYLLRFFDYVSVMPEGNRQKYIERLFEHKEVFNDIDLTLLVSTLSEPSFSIRDVNIIFRGYLGFVLHNFKFTKDIGIYVLYLKLFVWKYKEPHKYIYMLKNIVNIELTAMNWPEVRRSLNCDALSYDCKLSDMTILFDTETNKESLQPMSSSNSRGLHKCVIMDVKEDKIFLRGHSGYSAEYEFNFEISKESVIAGFLTYDDLFNWNAIKDILIRDFLFSKLEMYDFSETLL